MVDAFTVVIVAASAFWLVCGHFRKLHAVHQAVHSPDADVNAIITLEDELHLVSAETFVIISMNMENKAFDMLVFRHARGSPAAEMFVVGAPVDAKYAAQGFDVMLETEPMYGI